MEGYNNSLCPASPIYQANWEFSELLKIYNTRQPKRVLEIGSMFGGTLWHWFQSKPDRLVAIDVVVSDADGRNPAHVYAHQQFYNWAAEAGKTWFTLIEGDSRDPNTVAQVNNETFDFLFIDGDHNYEAAKSDFLNYGPLVADGGIIAFHDILPSPHWTGIDVFKLWKEIQEAGYITQELLCSHDQMFNTGTYGIGLVYL